MQTVGRLKQMGRMTPRERFKAVINFEKPDRLPWVETGMEPYLFKWHKEGFPVDEAQKIAWDIHTNKNPTFSLIDEPISSGLDLSSYFGFQDLQEFFVPVDLGPIPKFTVKTLGESEKHVRIRTKTGKILKYRKDPKGFASYIMPTYEEFPVKDRRSWENYKERLDPKEPRRYPKDWDEDDYREIFEQIRKGPTSLFLNGFYGFGQRLMGVSDFIVAFYKDPNLIEDMAEHWEYFTMESVRKAVETLGERIDYVFWWEDMAEKNGPNISPDLYERFLLPRYKEVTGFLNENGIDRIMMDSDGNTEAILDLAIEAGITGHWPLEVNVGMDARELREKYGKKLFLVGNIDKRKVVDGGEAMREEVDSKVPELKERGGYIPGLDHIIPADCSYENFKAYVKYMKKHL